MQHVKLKTVVEKIISEGGKLFGTRAQRVSTVEMNKIFDELKSKFNDTFSQFKLSKALASKKDHGDIDIVISSNEANIGETLKNLLGKNALDYKRNGNIFSFLYASGVVNKNVHVDFIAARDDEYDAQYDYLSYNDFGGVLGVFARKIGFSYGGKGFFKIYIDKKNQHHYILLTKNLREGLKMMGYGNVINKFDEIKTPVDVAEFISSTDLFDSKYFSDGDFNRSDRRRLRHNRTVANEIKDILVDMNKNRTQPDNDFFVKKLFPKKYEYYMEQVDEIENKVVAKSKYNGEWIIKNFPQLKPGPIIGKILQYLQTSFESNLNDVDPNTIISAISNYLRDNQ